MAEPRLTVARFVKAAARVELARSAGAHEPAVAGRMLVRLHQELAKVMGPAAFDVILARALVLARRAHPVLAGVTAGPSGAITGLDDATGDGVARQEGGMAIVTHFIEFLATLLGEDLAMRLVGEIWRGAAEEEER
ncbi:MAG TPA: hypothetical protein VKU41_01990 [Polyangiaceae bacterium]|nr:hypothetical protein [Polyangiaceae bacterium]